MNKWTKLFGALLLLLAAIIAWNMYTRATQQLLWGYRPLFFYLFAYAGLVFIFFRFKGPLWLGWGLPQVQSSLLDSHTVAEKNSFHPTSYLVLATLAGFLLGFGYPGYLPAPFLLVTAFVPLLILQRRLRINGASNKMVFFYGFHSFLLFNVLATYWVTNTAFGPGLFAVTVNSFLMCIPWMLFHFATKSIPKVAYLSLPVYWISFEWFHYNWELNWPWLTLGNGFAQFPSLVQWYEYTGVLGGSLWIWLINLLIFFLLTLSSPEQSNRKFSLYTLGTILLPIVFSLIRYTTYSVPEGNTISVAVIQPNFEPHYEDNSSSRTVLDTFGQLTTAALVDGPLDYVLYPEVSINGVVEDTPMDNRVLQALREQFQEQGLRYLV
ncbi:MAG: hypothetical protein AAFU67_18005, partial [Bacteroidota bacterium]